MVFERLILGSGQGADDPATGRRVGTDMASRTEQCLMNLRTILRAAGSDLQYVLRCGVFLIDMNDFKEMNGVYAGVFGASELAVSPSVRPAAGGRGGGVMILTTPEQPPSNKD